MPVNPMAERALQIVPAAKMVWWKLAGKKLTAEASAGGLGRFLIANKRGITCVSEQSGFH
jgi:hypothetical protein